MKDEKEFIKGNTLSDIHAYLFPELHYKLKKILPELLKDNIHQKKVIDRLSRKIQRLKKEINQDNIALYSQEQVIETKSEYNFYLICVIEKAYNYIKENLSWAVGSEELIKILEGKDE